jgi:hypothetical protein
MLKTLFKYVPNMIVRERIMDNLPMPVVLDEIGKPQGFKLVRYGGFGHTKQNGQVAYAHIFA